MNYLIFADPVGFECFFGGLVFVFGGRTYLEKCLRSPHLQAKVKWRVINQMCLGVWGLWEITLLRLLNFFPFRKINFKREIRE